MNKISRISILLLLLTGSTVAQTPKDYTKRSAQIYEWIRQGEFGKVILEFDTSVSNKVDSAKLAGAWANLRKTVGEFVKVNETTTEHQDKYDVVIQKSEFEKKQVDFKLVYGENEKVRGIFFVPVVKKFKFDDPEYYNKELFTEKRKQVVTGEFRLPAILTVPNGVTKPPLAILVHGSGPNDKDETVGNTKIFRDIAVGLAAQGVAVLRYDKRTRNYPAKMQEGKLRLTVKQETMDDVISAIRLELKDSLIDTNRIFLIGHSLGGMLLPRIVGQTEDVKGIIMLAANARPMEDLMMEQAEYLSAQQKPSAEVSSNLDSMRASVKRIKELSAKDAKDTVGVLGIPVSYWLDLKTYDPVKAAAQLKMPVLVLSGGRDYQVPETDFSMWKSGLKDSPNAKFRSYPKANHFFINGEGKSLPEEYDLPGHVDKAVIDDISSFILHGKLN